MNILFERKCDNLWLEYIRCLNGITIPSYAYERLRTAFDLRINMNTNFPKLTSQCSCFLLFISIRFTDIPFVDIDSSENKEKITKCLCRSIVRAIYIYLILPHKSMWLWIFSIWRKINIPSIYEYCWRYTILILFSSQMAEKACEIEFVS